MDELEFYDGAYSGQQIDGSIALIVDNLSGYTITDRTGGALSNLIYNVVKVGKMVLFNFRATTTAAISERFCRLTGWLPRRTA